MQDFKLSASILSADFAYLAQEVETVLEAGADWIHVDVMDHHYVPNLTIGPVVLASLKKHFPNVFFDVHLMVKPVDDVIKQFADAGASLISFHPEASHHVDRSLQLIQSLGCQTGLALNPATSLSVLEHTWPMLDLVLLMSVNPGFGGQKFIACSLEKAQKTRAYLEAQQSTARLEIDGGVQAQNIREIAQAGVDTFVAGSAIFHSNDYKKTIQDLRAALD